MNPDPCSASYCFPQPSILQGVLWSWLGHLALPACLPLCRLHLYPWSGGPLTTHHLLCLLSPHFPALNICSLPEVHILEDCLPMSPLPLLLSCLHLVSMPTASHLCPVLWQTASPYYSPAWQALQFPAAEASSESTSPACSAALPHPLSPLHNFSWAWKPLPPGTTHILREAWVLAASRKLSRLPKLGTGRPFCHRHGKRLPPPRCRGEHLWAGSV